MQRVLVISFDALGDFFLSEAAFFFLHQELIKIFPCLRLDLLCSPRNFDLAKEMKIWSNIYPIFLNGSKDNAIFPDSNLLKVFDQKYDLVANFFDEPDLHAINLIRAIGKSNLISLKLRYKDARANQAHKDFHQACQKVVEPFINLPNRGAEHFVLRTFSLAIAILQWVKPSTELNLYPPAKIVLDQVENWRKKLTASHKRRCRTTEFKAKILFHPFGSHKGNRLPLGKATEILQSLSRIGEVWVFIETLREVERLKAKSFLLFRPRLKSSLVKWKTVDCLPPQDILGAIQNLVNFDLIVSSLTSIFHFAAVLDLPTLGLRDRSKSTDEFLPLWESSQLCVLGTDLSKMRDHQAAQITEAALRLTAHQVSDLSLHPD